MISTMSKATCVINVNAYRDEYGYVGSSFIDGVDNDSSLC